MQINFIMFQKKKLMYSTLGTFPDVLSNSLATIQDNLEIGLAPQKIII